MYQESSGGDPLDQRYCSFISKRTTLGSLVIIVFFLGRIQIFGQELTVGAQVRPRAEFRNGFKTLTEDDRDAAFFVEQRTRLFTDYKTNKFRIRINLQDVRIWGSVDQIAKSDPNLFNLYEGWGEYYINDKLAVRMDGHLAATAGLLQATGCVRPRSAAANRMQRRES